MTNLHALFNYLTGPNALPTFWLPVLAIAALVRQERRLGRFKLPAWLLITTAALLPATYHLSFWREAAQALTFHVVPLPLLVVLVFSWMRSKVSTTAAVVLLYAHVLAIDAAGLHAFMQQNPQLLPAQGWLYSLGGAGWFDVLLRMPLYFLIALRLLQILVIDALEARQLKESASS